MKAPRLLLARGLPTPVEALPEQSVHGGGRRWVKRDDLAGGRYPGGGAWRKLEYIFAEVQANGARSVVTWGTHNSSFSQAVALAARDLRIDCTIISESDEPLAGDDPAGARSTSNIDGAGILYVKTGTGEEVARMEFEKAWEQGRRPYLIPFGGTMPAGVLGYRQAFDEFLVQKRDVETLVVPVETGCSLAGLLIGAKMTSWPGRIIGLNDQSLMKIDKMRIATIANNCIDFINSQIRINQNDIRLIPSETLALNDGEEITKAEKLIEELMHAGLFDSNVDVLFWNTGTRPNTNLPVNRRRNR